MDNPLTLILGGFGCTIVGLVIGYLLGRLHTPAPPPVPQPRPVPPPRQAPPPSAPPQRPQPAAAAPSSPAPPGKWAHPPSRVLEIPSRVVDAMAKETGALDLNKDGQVALKVAMMTTNGRTRYTLRNEEEGVTHAFDRLEDVPAQWRPLVDRFLAGQREIFGGKQQIPRPPKR